MNGSFTLPQLDLIHESATIDGILPLKISCFILSSSHCFFFLLYVVSWMWCMLLQSVVGIGTLFCSSCHLSLSVLFCFVFNIWLVWSRSSTRLLSRVLHSVLYHVFCFRLAFMMLLLCSLCLLFCLDSFPHYSWFPTYWFPSRFIVLLYHCGYWSLFSPMWSIYHNYDTPNPLHCLHHLIFLPFFCGWLINLFPFIPMFGIALVMFQLDSYYFSSIPQFSSAVLGPRSQVLHSVVLPAGCALVVLSCPMLSLLPWLQGRGFNLQSLLCWCSPECVLWPCYVAFLQCMLLQRIVSIWSIFCYCCWFCPSSSWFLFSLIHTFDQWHGL